MTQGIDGGDERSGDALAPVIPLFGRQSAPVVASADGPVWDRTWIDDSSASAPNGEAKAAEDVLLRKLRTRQLSVIEARRVLRERDIDDAAADEVLDRFSRQGYLDDQRLAEQLAYAAVSRKGQGKRAIARALTARGIPRDVADAAVHELPDDEDERALEFARTRVHRVGDDPDAALRRLVGQLTRRGFSSSAAMSAARTALGERR